MASGIRPHLSLPPGLSDSPMSSLPSRQSLPPTSPHTPSYPAGHRCIFPPLLPTPAAHVNFLKSKWHHIICCLKLFNVAPCVRGVHMRLPILFHSPWSFTPADVTSLASPQLCVRHTSPQQPGLPSPRLTAKILRLLGISFLSSPAAKEPTVI